ncbi:MAG: GTPase Era [Firmicutes bacterium]|nr:GTPase Era [Bacillota bacterium]
MEEKAFRSGFIGLFGRPNVGKSSLVNALVGRKVAIVSPKPQTTRRRVQAVLTLPEAQIVFLDTPGIQRARDLLGRALVRAAREAVEGIDAAFLVVDASRARWEEDRASARLLSGAPVPVLLVVNKIDLVPGDEEEIASGVAAELNIEGPYLATSALTGEGLEALKEWALGVLKPGPKYFPDEVYTDQPEEVLVAELIREQILLRLAEEVPHETAVRVLEMTPRPTGKLYINALIVVERESQKAIVIGAGGRMLKEIGSAARLEIERLLGTPVYLELWVKAVEGWRDSPARLREFGYESLP